MAAELSRDAPAHSSHASRRTRWQGIDESTCDFQITERNLPRTDVCKLAETSQGKGEDVMKERERGRSTRKRRSPRYCEPEHMKRMEGRLEATIRYDASLLMRMQTLLSKFAGERNLSIEAHEQSNKLTSVLVNIWLAA